MLVAERNQQLQETKGTTAEEGIDKAVAGTLAIATILEAAENL
jgi:hypothetical protein